MIFKDLGEEPQISIHYLQLHWMFYKQSLNTTGYCAFSEKVLTYWKYITKVVTGLIEQ